MTETSSNCAHWQHMVIKCSRSSHAPLCCETMRDKAIYWERECKTGSSREYIQAPVSAIFASRSVCMKSSFHP